MSDQVVCDSTEERPASPGTVRQQIIVGVVGSLLGNLMTVAVVYLILVAGQFAPPRLLLIVISAVMILILVGIVLSVGLWARGSFGNNYTQASLGKRSSRVTSFAFMAVLAVAALLVLIYLATIQGLK